MDKNTYELLQNSNTLLDRVEDKYLLSKDRVEEFSAIVKTYLKFGDIDTEVRFNQNRTYYLDTKDLDVFFDCVSSIRPRFKVRIRQYAPNGGAWENVAYLELKAKKKDGSSQKIRVRIPASMIDSICMGVSVPMSNDLANLNRDQTRDSLDKNILLLNNVLLKYGLKKSLVVTYNRRSYSGNDMRISIDSDLRYYDATRVNYAHVISNLGSMKGWKNFKQTYDKFGTTDKLVLEVKHSGSTPKWLKRALVNVGAKSISFSKYCAASIGHVYSGKQEDTFQRSNSFLDQLISLPEPITKSEVLQKSDKASPPFYASVVIIDSTGAVMLGKRSEDGIWTPPGGGANEGETPEQAASREVFEEAGIAIDPRFLQKLPNIETRNGKICHCFLYVAAVGHIPTSKLDPDQEVKTWKFFPLHEIPDALRNDLRRFESVRNAYMKFRGVRKSMFEKLEAPSTHNVKCDCTIEDMLDHKCGHSVSKGGKPAATGEIRTFSGKQYQKMGDGNWKPYVHPEEKQLENEKKNKVLSLTQKLQQKVDSKKEITHGEKHLNDLKNQAVVEGQETRSGKPMFTRVDDGLAHGYKSEDFREVGNFFFDRAQKMTDNISQLENAKQPVDPSFEKIKKINLQYSKAFISQANHIDDRHSKTKAAAVKKSVVMMTHLDGAEIETSRFAQDNAASRKEGTWLDQMQILMENYSYGDVPRMIALDKGDLYIAKVDEGMYSGVFKRVTGGEYESSNESLVDNAKVRIERMTLPSLVQFCVAKEWISDKKESPVLQEPQVIDSLTEKLELPAIQPLKVDKTIQVLELINKLIG